MDPTSHGVSFRGQGEVAVITLAAPLDPVGSLNLADQFEALERNAEIRSVIVDLQHLERLDATGLGVFVTHAPLFARRGIRLALVGMPPALLATFESLRQSGVVQVHADAAAAMRALQGADTARRVS